MQVKSKQIKDKKIKVYRGTVSEDDGGETQVCYKPLYPAPLWAYYRDLSTKEMFLAQSYGSNTRCIFVINYHPEITIRDVIVFNGKKYNISEIDHFQGGKNDIKLTCRDFTGMGKSTWED